MFAPEYRRTIFSPLEDFVFVSSSVKLHFSLEEEVEVKVEVKVEVEVEIEQKEVKMGAIEEA